MGKIEEKIEIDIAHKHSKGKLYVVQFKDHNAHIAYVPSLNLSGYGDTPQAAVEMLFKDVVSDLFHSLFELKESDITKELRKYGWKKSKLLKRRFSNTPYVDKEGILRNFNLPAETEISDQLMSV